MIQFISVTYVLLYMNVWSSVIIVVKYLIKTAANLLEDILHLVEQRPSL